MANIWLLAIFLIPIALVTFLRVNAVFVYLGLCLGYVLSEFDGGSRVVTQLSKSRVIERLGGSSDVRVILLLLPAVVILLAMVKTTHGNKLSLNLLPAISVGILAVISLVPILPLKNAVSIMTGSLWHNVSKYEGTLIATSTLVVTVMFIVSNSKFSHSSKGSKHHKSKE